jgi:hypothetical protein
LQRLPKLLRRAVVLALVCEASIASPAGAALGDCMQPVSHGSGPTASDCLYILRAAVGSSTCDPACICDPTADGRISASDALRCLRGPGQTPFPPPCPCGTTTTTTITTTTTVTAPSSTSTSVLPSTTTTTLIVRGCGDVVVSETEECDPPALQGGAPTCKANCRLSVCGDGDITEGEHCEDDSDCSGGSVCGACCTCTDARCPGVVRWTMRAGVGDSVTPTQVDLGWTGLDHDFDHPDGSRLALRVCADAGSTIGTCNSMSVRGVDPWGRNCRCADDNRVLCNDAGTRPAQCGGSQCVCYVRPPEPMSGGNTPICVVSRFDGDPQGLWNADDGSGVLEARLRVRYFLGETNKTPCPKCQGDDVANDGVRNGTCTMVNAGLPCDANASDATFPPPDGGEYSYDCFPVPGKNLSGPGIRVDPFWTTGDASIESRLPCGIEGASQCPCGVCAGDESRACAKNVDCDMGPCGPASLLTPLPNACDDGECADVGTGEGECTTGPDDRFCDSPVRANGEGYVQCLNNADCLEPIIDPVPHTCGLTRRRRCFLPTIEVEGSASATDPVLATTYCSPSAGGFVDTVAGLPGPVREKLQVSTELPCAAAPDRTYPDCPPP